MIILFNSDNRCRTKVHPLWHNHINPKCMLHLIVPHESPRSALKRLVGPSSGPDGTDGRELQAGCFVVVEFAW